MKIFVIIVTYNASKWIHKCFGSLKNSPVPLEIIAIDNNSTDDTVEALTINYPPVEIYEGKENLGFGKANNIGIRKALERGADYIFLLNQDAWLDPRFIAGLIDIHKKNTDFGILSPIHLNGEGNALDYRFSISCNDISCPGFVSDMYLKKMKDLYEISFANAALWLISKECILKSGVFDPVFPHYGEDTDYVNRIRYHGFKIGICPQYYGFHDREKRPASEKRDRAIIDLGYICDLKDINHSFYYSFLRFFSSYTANIFKKSLKGNIGSAVQDIKFLIHVLILIPRIIKTRKICKKTLAYI